MTGEIKQTYLSDVHSRVTEDEQLSFNQFTDDEDGKDELGTTIAVVTEPTGKIRDVCDEFIQELGMPKYKLHELREIRDDLDIDDDVKCHNKAVEQAGLEEEYREYLQGNEVVQDILDRLATRVKNGETITVVCFEEDSKWCHRHVLVDELKERIDT